MDGPALTASVSVSLADLVTGAVDPVSYILTVGGRYGKLSASNSVGALGACGPLRR